MINVMIIREKFERCAEWRVSGEVGEKKSCGWADSVYEEYTVIRLTTQIISELSYNLIFIKIDLFNNFGNCVHFLYSLMCHGFGSSSLDF